MTFWWDISKFVIKWHFLFVLKFKVGKFITFVNTQKEFHSLRISLDEEF